MKAPHRSIGDVLTVLQDEFPDVTISKIRYLESQGLVSPERTSSGIRKFYDDDIELLRWVLRLQTQHFLPLKVIQDRLAANGGKVPTLDTSAGAAVAADLPRGAGPLDAKRAPVLLNRDELCAASGLEDKAIGQLLDYGMIEGHPSGGDTVFDADALHVAKVAAQLVALGVGVRQQRMFKMAADRESGVLEQVIAPMRKAADDEGESPIDRLGRCALLGEQMRVALLRQNLREHLD